MAVPLQHLDCYKRKNDSTEQQSYTSSGFHSHHNAMNVTTTPML